VTWLFKPSPSDLVYISSALRQSFYYFVTPQNNFDIAGQMGIDQVNIACMIYILFVF